jgi:hypothetical protein
MGEYFKPVLPRDGDQRDARGLTRRIWGFARTYVLSLAGVLSFGFLLLISMLVTTALSATGKYLAPYLPEAALQMVSCRPALCGS